jgi:hypothetical protein
MAANLCTLRNPREWIRDDRYVLLCIAAATFAVGFVFWIRLVPGYRSGMRRGAIAGLLTGIVSDPVTWALYSFTVLQPEGKHGLDEFVRGLETTLIYSFVSLLIFGIFTVLVTTPTGAIVGYVFSRTLKTGEREGL